MTEEQKKKVLEVIKSNEEEFNFNNRIIIDPEWLNTIEDIVEELEKINENYQYTDTEIIYYHNAIKYLEENDPSLIDSLTLADEYWFVLSKLNSEILASILKSKNTLEDYNTFCTYVKNDLEQSCLFD